MSEPTLATALVAPFEHLRMTDVEVVGGKNASLGEMISQLAASGVRVPGGFATTAHAFRQFLHEGGLTERIDALLTQLDVDDVRALTEAGAKIRGWVVDTPFPAALEAAVRAEFARLTADNPGASFAVRSSATAEDLPDASFAGQLILQRHRPVSSRTGENLFWLGRYTERTEQLVRLARSTLAALSTPGTTDDDSEAQQALMLALSTLAVKTGLAPQGVPTLVQSAHLFERALLAGLGDRKGADGTASIAYNLAALERSSTALRERLSPEHWGLIRAMREGFARDLEVPAGELPARAQVLAALDRLALQLAAVTGAQTDRMTRDHGWRLLTVGRLLERLIGVTLRLADLPAQRRGRSASHRCR